jgi:hypothetical protein
MIEAPQSTATRAPLAWRTALVWALMPGVSYFVVFDVVSLPGENWTLVFLVLHFAIVWSFAGLILLTTTTPRARLGRSLVLWFGALVAGVAAAGAAMFVPASWTLPISVRLAWWRDGATVAASGVSPFHIERADSLDLSSHYVRWRRLEGGDHEFEWEGKTYRAGSALEWHEHPHWPGHIEFATYRINDEWCYVLELT